MRWSVRFLAPIPVAVLVAATVTSAAAHPSPPRDQLTLSLSPGTREVAAADAAQFDLTVQYPGPAERLGWSASGLPRGATASFAAAADPHPPGAWVLSVSTSPSTAPGRYRGTVTVRARRGEASVTFGLTVRSRPVIAIRGNPQHPLAPGISEPLDLTLTNPSGSTLRLELLTVEITGLTQASSAAARPCPVAGNYRTVPLGAAGHPILLPAGSTRTLTSLGVPRDQLPQLEMIETWQNQDACQGAVLTLHYSATASEEHPGRKDDR